FLGKNIRLKPDKVCIFAGSKKRRRKEFMSEIDISLAVQDKKTDKELYNYQKGAIEQIFEKFETAPEDYHLLYQLPTGGGKTVIFSEIVRQYLKIHQKKV